MFLTNQKPLYVFIQGHQKEIVSQFNVRGKQRASSSLHGRIIANVAPVSEGVDCARSKGLIHGPKEEQLSLGLCVFASSDVAFGTLRRFVCGSAARKAVHRVIVRVVKVELVRTHKHAETQESRMHGMHAWADASKSMHACMHVCMFAHMRTAFGTRMHTFAEGRKAHGRMSASRIYVLDCQPTNLVPKSESNAARSMRSSFSPRRQAEYRSPSSHPRRHLRCSGVV
eukprot:6172606-Pleurochrysis_carterae.AAC.1